MVSALRLDMHNHLKVAKRMPFRLRDAERFARTLLRRGLHGGAVTEHFHAQGFWRMYASLAAHHEYKAGRFEIGGALFFSGAELTLAEKIDVLIIAPLHELRRLDDAFGAALSEGHHPTALEFADTVEALRLRALKIAAHPMRPGRSIHRLDATLLERMFDAVEINARFAADDEAEVRAFAARTGTPLTGGSDAHVWLQAGAAWTEIDAEADTFEALSGAVSVGRCRAVVHHEAAELCESGAEWKAALKAAHYAFPAGAPSDDAGEFAHI
ncbi:MAG: PHP domain-containing protein [Phycisphaerales bacterium]|nr:PHP domain-containing protein [Phycisphaerales bacterium]